MSNSNELQRALSNLEASNLRQAQMNEFDRQQAAFQKEFSETINKYARLMTELYR